MNPAGHHVAQFDVVVVGAGAAGLATAIFAARQGLGGRVLVVDGARRLGAKILVSGGGRCNVTNTIVTERDFAGGSCSVVRQVLRAFPVPATLDFFREIGVGLHEEEDGKLFPDSNRARTVLDALLVEAERRGIRLSTACRVTSLSPDSGTFRVGTTGDTVTARRVVLATGGMSLPKTGSDGGGYALARGLGHSIVPPTPALVPLLLEGAFHHGLSGVSQPVSLELHTEGGLLERLSGALLWTHFGVSGPVVLNASRFWHRAELEGRRVRIHANLTGGRPFESVEREIVETAASRPRLSVRASIAGMMPAAVAEAVLDALHLDPARGLGGLTREDRRRLVHAVVAWPLSVRGSRGYAFAEVTAGGVPLAEVHAGRMESRACPGLFLVGEILDVDGRIGGFNFQWAWSTGFVAARSLARREPP